MFGLLHSLVDKRHIPFFLFKNNATVLFTFEDILDAQRGAELEVLVYLVQI